MVHHAKILQESQVLDLAALDLLSSRALLFVNHHWVVLNSWQVDEPCQHINNCQVKRNDTIQKQVKREDGQPRELVGIALLGVAVDVVLAVTDVEQVGVLLGDLVASPHSVHDLRHEDDPHSPHHNVDCNEFVQ